MNTVKIMYLKPFSATYINTLTNISTAYTYTCKYTGGQKFGILTLMSLSLKNG